jgi:hypothetical protein
MAEQRGAALGEQGSSVGFIKASRGVLRDMLAAGDVRSVSPLSWPLEVELCLPAGVVQVLLLRCYVAAPGVAAPPWGEGACWVWVGARAVGLIFRARCCAQVLETVGERERDEAVVRGRLNKVVDGGLVVTAAAATTTKGCRAAGSDCCCCCCYCCRYCCCLSATPTTAHETQRH